MISDTLLISPATGADRASTGTPTCRSAFCLRGPDARPLPAAQQRGIDTFAVIDRTKHHRLPSHAQTILLPRRTRQQEGGDPAVHALLEDVLDDGFEMSKVATHFVLDLLGVSPSDRCQGRLVQLNAGMVVLGSPKHRVPDSFEVTAETEQHALERDVSGRLPHDAVEKTFGLGGRPDTALVSAQ